MTGARKDRSKLTRLMGDAACRNEDPNMFTDPKLAIWGLKICRTCTVTTECADVRGYSAEGVYGGKAHYPKNPRR